MIGNCELGLEATNLTFANMTLFNFQSLIIFGLLGVYSHHNFIFPKLIRRKLVQHSGAIHQVSHDVFPFRDSYG